MATHKEIYNKFFDESEREKVEKKAQEEGLKEKLDTLEIVDQRLNSLQAKTVRTPENFEERFNDWKETVLRLEEEQKGKGIIDKAKQKAQEEFQKKKDEKFKELRLLANKTAPFGIGGAIFDWAIGLIDGCEEKEGDGVSKKFFKKIGMGIGLFFIGKLCGEKVYEKWKSMKFGVEEKENSKVKKEEKVGEEKESLQEAIGEITKDKYSDIGFFILTKTCSIKEHPKALFGKFENENYLSLNDSFRKMDNNGEMIIKEVENFKKQNKRLGIEKYTNEDIYNLLKLFCASKTAGILYKQKLSPDKIKSILKNNDNMKLEKILGKVKLEEIKSKNYDFKKFDLKTITLLIGLSYENLLGTGVGILGEKVKNLFGNLFFGENDIFSGIEKNIKQRQENLLPAKVIGLLTDKISAPEEVEITEQELIKNEKLGEIDKEKLSNFLNFRDEILRFMGDKNNKFALGLPRFRENLKGVISLKEILYLYFTFDGKTDFLNTEDSVIKGGIFVWLYKLFENNKKTVNFAGEYLSVLDRNIRSESSKYFSENDKIFINIFIYKIVGVYILPFEKTVALAEGWTRNKLINLCMEMGIDDKNVAEGLAYAMEIAGTGVSILVFKKLKCIRFFFYPFIGYVVGALALEGYNKYLEEALGKKNYKVFEEGFNMYLQENPQELEVEKDGEKIKLKVRSLEEASEFKRNPKSVIEKQDTIMNYTLNDGHIILDRDNTSYEVDPNKIVFQKDGTGFYIIKYKGKNYKIGFGPYPSTEWFNNNDYKGKEIDFSKFKLELEGIKFGIGGQSQLIPYSIIENKLKYGNMNDGWIFDYYIIFDDLENKLLPNPFSKIILEKL